MYRKELYYLAVLILVLTAAGRVFGLDPLQQDTGTDGIVSVEAENFDENVPNDPHTWDLITGEWFLADGWIQRWCCNAVPPDTSSRRRRVQRSCRFPGQQPATGL